MTGPLAETPRPGPRRTPSRNRRRAARIVARPGIRRRPRRGAPGPRYAADPHWKDLVLFYGTSTRRRGGASERAIDTAAVTIAVVLLESKDDLIAQAITHMFDGTYDRFLRVTEGREPEAAIASYVDFYLSPSHRLERANGCPIAILSGDLPNLSACARERFTDGAERVVAALAKLAKKLGAKHAEALAWSAIAEMAGALALSRTVSDARAAAILRSARGSRCAPSARRSGHGSRSSGRGGARSERAARGGRGASARSERRSLAPCGSRTRGERRWRGPTRQERPRSRSGSDGAADRG
jgi:hypothetical protein